MQNDYQAIFAPTEESIYQIAELWFAIYQINTYIPHILKDIVTEFSNIHTICFVYDNMIYLRS